MPHFLVHCISAWVLHFLVHCISAWVLAAKGQERAAVTLISEQRGCFRQRKRLLKCPQRLMSRVWHSIKHTNTVHWYSLFWVIHCLFAAKQTSPWIPTTVLIWFLTFCRRRDKTHTRRAYLLWRSRMTQTQALRGRRWRRRRAACTPATCATRSSRRAARCWDTNMNTQVNTNTCCFPDKHTKHKHQSQMELQ